jgi:hypothetical protein
MASPDPGQKPRQRGQNRPVRPFRPGSGDLAAQYSELVAQYEDLYIFRCL